MKSQTHRQIAEGRNPLTEALIGYGVFCALGLVSRFMPAFFILFVAYGIAFPLV